MILAYFLHPKPVKIVLVDFNSKLDAQAIMKYFSLLLLLILPTTAYAQINAFGLSSEVIHNSVLVGHPFPGDEAPGSVYVYHPSEDGSTWEVSSELMASDAKSEDGFGYRITSNGDHLAIGAPSLGDHGGAVYIFAHNSDTGEWEEVAKLSGTQEFPIGGSVAFSETTLVTGGMTGADSTGSVSVYVRGENGFEEAGILTHENVQVSDYFGTSIAIAENGTVYVGAPGANEGVGAVYHFENHGDQWHGTQILSGDHEDIRGRGLGVSLEIDAESRLFAGAPGIVPNVQPTAPPPPGKLVWAMVDAEGSEVVQTLDSGIDNYDFFGLGFSSDHSTLLVGAPLSNGQVGEVWQYELDRESMLWTKTSTIDAGVGDQLFGMIISIEGNTAVISAPASNLGKGTIRVASMDTDSGVWTSSDALKTGKEVILFSSGAVECADGIAGQFDCGNVDLLSYMTGEDLGGGPGIITNDVWGWVDPETNREYALVGRSNGTSFVDITDPTNPVLKGDLPLTDGANPNSWRDIKVYADHAFIVADNVGEHGMQVFDLTHLREDSDSPVTYTEDALYDGIASAHNIVINEDTGYAYIVGSSGGGETCGGGLHMVNIQDPLSPQFVGCFADPSTGRSGTGYSHDAQCVIYEGPDSEHIGKEICFNSNETALSISDVTDKENPMALSVAEYPNVSYAHQGWITDDFEYFYMNDEIDELSGKVVGTRTLIWNISDLDDPLLEKEFTSENLSSDHNLYILGDVMYQSNYMSGLRIFDISDRTNPVEIGFFDTHPIGTDKPGFEGSWSNYPYFPSGTIIVTSINEGLFIVRKQNLDI